ncbi:gluconate 2-dehydrogenase subunit 3 family protein [Flexivirga lutea]
MIGRYPDYDVLDSADSWDEVTRAVVMARLDPPGPMRFFAPAEEPTLRAFCDVATGQDADPRVPVAEAVDTKLADGRLDGYQYADMPDDRETWHKALVGLEQTAQQRFGTALADLEMRQQEQIVGDLSTGDLSGGVWDELDVNLVWKVCMRAILAGFYSHPWAWNEIGFGGPAYPRGYMRTGALNSTEPFERPGADAEDPVAAVQDDPEMFPS